MQWQTIKIGRSFKLNVYKEGVSIWYKDRWVIDASCIAKDRRVAVHNNEEARLKIEVVEATAPNKRVAARKARPKLAKRQLRHT
jgi:hypothetical protein